MKLHPGLKSKQEINQVAKRFATVLCLSLYLTLLCYKTPYTTDRILKELSDLTTGRYCYTSNGWLTDNKYRG